MSITKKVIRNIVIISLEKNIEHKEIAKEMGVSSAFLSAIIHGKKKLPLDRLPAIAKALGVSVERLIK